MKTEVKNAENVEIADQAEAEFHNAEEVVNSELMEMEPDPEQMTTPKMVLETYDLSKPDAPLPNLAESTLIPYDLVQNYWTPENDLEVKNCFFIKLEKAPVLDSETKELTLLLCAFFLEQLPDGQTRQIYNGSKILVGTVISHGIKYGTPLQITYIGKRKNKTNGHKSDTWSIKPFGVKKELAQ